MNILNKDLCLNILSGIPEPLFCIHSLINIYKDVDVKIENGTGPNTPLIYASANNHLLMMEAGITVQELIFFYSLLHRICPKNIYGVGNAFGWSTLAFAIISPASKIVVIDNLANFKSIGDPVGMKITKSIIEKNNFNVTALVAESPKDSYEVISEHLESKVDFAFIDGLHTNEQVVQDFDAIKFSLHSNSVVVFHDVIKHNMSKGWKEISIAAKKLGFTSKILDKTYSGIGIVYGSNMNIEDVINLYSIGITE